MNEHTFPSWDGTELFYRAWLPAQPAVRALVIFHRGHEHSGRLEHLAAEFVNEGYAVFAWDQRGHGKSPGRRGYAEDLSVFVRDVDSFIQHITESSGIPIEQVSVIANSVAAVLIGLWVHDYAPRIRAMVLAAPAFQVKLYVPFALPVLKLAQKLCRALGLPLPDVRSYVRGTMLTHDPKFAESYDADPLVSKQIAANILIDLFESSKRLIADAGAIVAPVLLLCARGDWVVKNAASRRFFRRLSSPLKRVQVYKGWHHSLFHESKRAEAIEATKSFLEDAYSRPLDYSFLADADKQGFTKEEYQWLRAGLPFLSIKRVGYRIQTAAMKSLGQLSSGVRLGWETGFDSGQSLDYVYRNQPQGATALGRLIDRCYLESIGWQGIRQRRAHIEQILRQLIASKREEKGEGSAVRVVDIAGGGGRYLVEVLASFPQDRVSALVRDRSIEALSAAAALAKEKGLNNVAFAEGDAFDEESLAAIDPRVDIFVVSGLYELFADNGPVLASLRGITRALAPGGCLIYTGQPWHPQLEMIAETLVNRDQQPWVMRRRTQAEMDELVRTSGLTKCGTQADRWGMFTVSFAQA